MKSSCPISDQISSVCNGRLVHSDGSLFDLSAGGAPQLLPGEEKRGGQRERQEETEEKWIKKEEEEEEGFSCMFDGETLSDPMAGKLTASS